MVSLMSKGFLVFLFILPDVILCAETKLPIFFEVAEGNRFYMGHLPGGERLPEKQMMKSGQPLPESFDAREQWPECKHIIDLIRDQKQCGSCWAFSVVEIISDRICIQSKGDKQVVISPEDLMTCCTGEGCYGCEGGDTAMALNYWKEIGIVTGGDFDSHEGCRPYTIPDKLNETYTPPCNKTCEEGYPIAYEADKHYGLTAYSIKADDVNQIQQEIYDNGPVSAAFHVYADFFTYKGGVYSHADTNDKKGAHAIKIIGWGEEDGTPYWLCANSWNTDWGDNGYFKMHRGDPENNCGMETYVLAGKAKL